MLIFHSKKEIQNYLSNQLDQKIGFIPTMGALHLGHLSLIDRAISDQNTILIVSIFVNPTQFENSDDLAHYPRTWQADIDLLSKHYRSIVVFAPSVSEMYKPAMQSKTFNFEGLAHTMEGKYRTGHFEGVATVLQLFFRIIHPDRVYLGEKDYQQLLIVKRLVDMESLPIEVVGCPIYREKNGLALSSRNARLSAEQKREASLLYHVLHETKENFSERTIAQHHAFAIKKFENNPYLKLVYFQITNNTSLETVTQINRNSKYRAFIAAFAGEVRLIDNLALN